MPPDEEQVDIDVKLSGIKLHVSGSLPVYWRHRFVDALRAAHFDVIVYSKRDVELEK